MISAAAISEGIESLPTLPESVARLTILLQDERSTIGDFEHAVHADPAVTANLLRAANSAYYHSDEPITTAGEAIARIGLNRVCEVAVAASYRRALPVRISGYGINAVQFWMHSAATRVFCRGALARNAAAAPGDRVYCGTSARCRQLVVGDFLPC
jgi:HD-like signal output (HDOD) protein